MLPDLALAACAPAVIMHVPGYRLFMWLVPQCLHLGPSESSSDSAVHQLIP
jgi:hypothetical protein